MVPGDTFRREMWTLGHRDLILSQTLELADEVVEHGARIGNADSRHAAQHVPGAIHTHDDHCTYGWLLGKQPYIKVRE